MVKVKIYCVDTVQMSLDQIEKELEPYQVEIVSYSRVIGEICARMPHQMIERMMTLPFIDSCVRETGSRSKRYVPKQN